MFSEPEQDLSFLREEASSVLMKKQPAAFLEKGDSGMRKVPPKRKRMERAKSALPSPYPRPICSAHEDPGPTVHIRLPKGRVTVEPVSPGAWAGLTREQVRLQDTLPGRA